MKILRLTLRNFGPYYGSQHLDLDVSDQAPVILVYGENERGKTSLLRSLRWCLYGEVLSQGGDPIDDREFANYDSRDELVPFEVSVEMEYEDQGSVNILKRWMKVEKDDSDESLVKVLGRGVELRAKGGNPIAEKDIPEQISRLLHKEISDFFLFDGETLTRFEQRLRSNESSASLVRESINKVLGYPALQLLSRDLESLSAAASKEVQSIAKKNLENAKILADIDVVTNEIVQTQSNSMDLKQMLKVLDERKLSLEAQLSQIDSIKDAFHERKSLRESKADLLRDIEGIREQVREKISSNWWAPAISMLKKTHENLEEQINEQYALSEKHNNLNRELNLNLRKISEQVCPTCNQTVDSSIIEAAKARSNQIETEIDEFPKSVLNIEEITLLKKQIEVYIRDLSVPERIHELEQDILKMQLRVEELKSRDIALTEILAGNTLDISALESDYQKVLLALRDTQIEIDRADYALEDAKTRLRKLQSSLNSSSGTSNPAKREAQVYSALEEILKNSLDQFRNQMREKVGEEASDIFRKLTTEPDYHGLKISGKYYLEIVDSNQRIVSRRSAGAEQIVAMSLIGALVRCAVRQGPVVMDTPFGRLDTGHRRRILEWAPTIGTQVMLFVQSGEFDRERDINYLGNKVGREFRIQREASNRSSIVGVQNG